MGQGKVRGWAERRREKGLKKRQKKLFGDDKYVIVLSVIMV